LLLAFEAFLTDDIETAYLSYYEIRQYVLFPGIPDFPKLLIEIAANKSEKKSYSNIFSFLTRNKTRKDASIAEKSSRHRPV
jgi:hypothetical protein